jgi:uncharacterized repeat protein (TIGR02543 family)
MATAKLWWNGSSWSTSSTIWVNESKNGNQSLGVSHAISIVAYDDFTIKMGRSHGAYQTASIYFSVGMSSDSVAVNSGGTSIGSGEFSNRDVTAYSSFSYSGSMQAVGTENYNAHYSGYLYFSGSTTISTPFYNVTYNANGGSDAPSATKGVKGFDGTLSATVPTRANHTFLGWATSSSAHTADYSAGDTIPARDSDITLYAVWMPTVFISADEGVTITFNGVAYTNQTATVTGLTWGNEYALLVTPNAGWIVKTQSHPNGNVEMDADEITITATGQRVGCHIDDGNEYVQAVIYMDTGNDWQMIQAYYDDGNSWQLVY